MQKMLYLGYTTTVMKYLILLLMLIGVNTYAQTAQVPTGNVAYNYSIKVNKKVSDATAYSLLQKWVGKNQKSFCRQNRDSIGYTVKSKNKQIVETEFANAVPLQTLEPNAKKMMAKCLFKYGGDESNCINILYVECFIVLEVKGNKVTVSATRFGYHHFSKKNFASVPIYNWDGGGKPFEGVGTLHELVDCLGANNKDVVKLMTYLNSDMGKLIAELRKYLSANKVLA
jgi:hypothetical protein